LQEGDCEVTKKKRTVNKFPKAFRKMAMERLKSCGSVTELAQELGVHRTLLYKWREQMEGRESTDGVPPRGEGKFRAEIQKLKRVVAEKTLEVDFFKGALQKVEARRQSKGVSGGKASSTKSGR
jgi:transposase-like protein